MSIGFRVHVNVTAVRRKAFAMAERRVTEGVNAIENRGVVLCPVDTGNLRRHHQKRVFLSGVAFVGEVYNTASYAKLVHNGHRGSGPFVIRPRRKKALRFVVAGEVFVVKKVNHPGVPPSAGRPWLRQAMSEIAPRYGFAVIR